MGALELTNIITGMWAALQQQGCIDGFVAIAAGIWAIVCFWEFANEAINVATGEATGIIRKFLTYAAIGLVITNWHQIAVAVFNGALALLTLFNNGVLSMMAQSDNLLMYLNDQGGVSLWGAITSPFQTAKMAFLAGVTIITVDIAYVITIALLVSTYAMLALHLCMGPVFMALGMSEALRSFCSHYIGAVVGYIATIPMFGAALIMIGGIYQGTYNIMVAQPGGGGLGSYLYVVLLAPVIAVVIIFSVAKVAASIAGGIGAGAATAVMAAGGGAAMSMAGSMAGGSSGSSSSGGSSGSSGGGDGSASPSVAAAVQGGGGTRTAVR